MPKVVTATSSDKEIIDAINAAGKILRPWRKHDWPDAKSKNQRSWVIANDIGHSSYKDRSLLRRLKSMTSFGLLEMCTHSRRFWPAPYAGGEARSFRGAPRFRVANTTDVQCRCGNHEFKVKMSVNSGDEGSKRIGSTERVILTCTQCDKKYSLCPG